MWLKIGSSGDAGQSGEAEHFVGKRPAGTVATVDKAESTRIHCCNQLGNSLVRSGRACPAA